MRNFKPTSTMISEVRWVDNPDSDTGTMYVEFRGGDVYRYNNVSLSKFIWFRDSDSAGSFFDKKIKNQYPSTRLPNGFPKRAAVAASA